MSSSQRSGDKLSCLLITANVGTIFEEADLLNLWFKQLKTYVTSVRAQLVAIHCQEVGGKNYVSSMKHVTDFTNKILQDEAITSHYDRVRIFLDDDYESLEKFTALGSLYLIDKSVGDVQLYNFNSACYETIEGKKVESTTCKEKRIDYVEKVKFPLELFPDCRWSRKGFMRTRWLFNGNKQLDLVNVHLFHDASNLVAMNSSPSPYAQNRQMALDFTLKHIEAPLKRTPQSAEAQQQQDVQVPLFIFGDFNFRLDTSEFIEKITEGLSPEIKRCSSSNEILQFIYRRQSVTSASGGSTGGATPVLPASQAEGVDNVKEQASAPSKGLKFTLDGQLDASSLEGDNNNVVDDQTVASKRARKAADDDVVAGSDDRDDDELAQGSAIVMTVGKKLFNFANLDETFWEAKNTEWLLELDKELDSFKNQLYEFKILFNPSYPFKEDSSGARSYMKTRCPAWCDRILFNPAACKMIYQNNKKPEVESLESSSCLIKSHEDQVYKSTMAVIEKLQQEGDIQYRLMGSSVPMGDHKPVLLYFSIDLSQPPTSNPTTTIESSSQTKATTTSTT